MTAICTWLHSTEMVEHLIAGSIWAVFLQLEFQRVVLKIRRMQSVETFGVLKCA